MNFKSYLNTLHANGASHIRNGMRSSVTRTHMTFIGLDYRRLRELKRIGLESFRSLNKTEQKKQVFSEEYYTICAYSGIFSAAVYPKKTKKKSVPM